MSADSRTVATDALATLGTIINKDQKRDAIHLAVIPMQAGVDLSAGQHVCIIDELAYREGGKLIGIVDPFIQSKDYGYAVPAGQWFWLVIYPRVITSLRHVWTHPDLTNEAAEKDRARGDAAASESWLKDFCSKADCPEWETVRKAIEGTLELDEEEKAYYSEAFLYESDYLKFFGTDAHASIPPVFWDHVEVVLGQKVPYRPGYFSCSC